MDYPCCIKCKKERKTFKENVKKKRKNSEKFGNSKKTPKKSLSKNNKTRGKQQNSKRLKKT